MLFSAVDIRTERAASGDGFEHNLLTARCEARFNIAVKQPDRIVKTTVVGPRSRRHRPAMP